MPDLSPYDLLLGQLLLPQPILDVLDQPFKELGYPLEKDTTEDPKLNSLEYIRAYSKDQQIVLLHVPSDIIGDSANWIAVANVADVFIGKTAGLFFFAPTKDLNRDYNGLLAGSWERKSPQTKKVKFFDQNDIDNLMAKAPPQRKKLVTLLLDVDKLLPPANGRPPIAGPPDVARIQDRIAEMIFDRYQTAGGDSKEFYLALRNGLKWPPDWFWEPEASPRDSARTLVVYLTNQRVYPAASNLNGYTTLGVLLESMISVVGGDTADEMFGIISEYHLIEKDDVLEDLRKRFKKV
jgi:hypothetical protein